MGVVSEGLTYSHVGAADQRIALRFGVQDDRLGANVQSTFIVDTGATSVSLPAYDLCLDREQASMIIKNGLPQSHVGVASDRPVQYYRYLVSKFRLGSKFVLCNFPVHITFDRGVHTRLVGMSFLKLFNIFIQPQHRTILFSALPVTERIVTGMESAEHIERLRVPYIGVEEVSDEEPVDGIDRPEFGVQGFKLT